MKREKNQKRDNLPKIQQDLRSRSQSPKAYLGCDTCKFKYNDLKKVKSTSKLCDISNSREKNKMKKIVEKNEEEIKEQKIKLIDLCDEDKKRVVELIQELLKLADKNVKLKEALEQAQQDGREQQEYIKKQSNLLVDEKNFYRNEINEYKNKIESLENELKTKSAQSAQWKNEIRSKDNEVASLAKALQKSLTEKNEFQEQINHLKTCLKHSLESFQKLRTELTILQNQEGKKFESVACQTKSAHFKKVSSITHEEAEDNEDRSTANQDAVNAKSSLDIINDKLEYVYQLLKKKSDGLIKTNSKKLDIDLSIFLKNQNKFIEENRTEDFPINISDNHSVGDSEEDTFGDNYKYLKPFDQCSKTSVQAQRILKTLGKPLHLILKESSQKLDSSNLDKSKSKESLVGLQNKIVQKNNLLKSKEHQYVEDRLLEELFYSDQNLNLTLGCQYENGGLAAK